jgi:hypothetical protein
MDTLVKDITAGDQLWRNGIETVLSTTRCPRGFVTLETTTGPRMLHEFDQVKKI